MRRLAHRNQAAVFVLFLAAIVFALNASSAFAASPPANTVAPSLSGTAQDGKLLTAAKGTWTGVGPITYTYQWQTSADGGGSWADIAGATATTFTPPAGSAGTQVRALVTATNGGGATQAASPASAVILPNPPLDTVAPTLSATAKDGVAITVAKGTWTGVATITYTYQWQASTDGGSSWTDIAGATTTSYTPPAGSAGKQVRALVTATNGDGSSQAATAASAVIVSNPPINTVAPSLTGTAKDGVALTAAKGTWTGMATITYTYQWQLTTDGGTTWTDIPGATATTYTPPAGNNGNQARVLVTATNPDGSSQATSPASAVILPNPPLNTVAPTLSATAKDGVAITVAKGTWTGVATITYTYQWQASTDGGSSWTDIAGATTTSYTPPAGSAGKQVRALVTATNGDGSSQAATAASAVIVSNPPINTVAPSLTGTAKDGVALTAAKGTWTGMATITYTYQWQLTTDGGTTWTDIPGATATTYTPPAGNNGNQARVLVTATNPDGSSQATSPASAVILPNPPLNTVAPTLSATAKDGVAITVAKGTWTGVATITYTYQWQASTDGGSSWTDIAGATTTSYTPPAGSAGKQVRALVTATNGDGSSQAATAASAVIVSNPPINTVAPSLTSTAKDGVALTAAKGTWTGMATITYTYQWQLTTDGGTTWTDIPGATATTYTPPAGNNGNQARVLVTATNPDGSSQATSPASAVILPNPPLDTATPTLTGTAQDGQPLGLTAGTWSGPGPIAYSYQWQISSDGGATWTDIAGATATTYTPPAGSTGKQLRVLETATNADGSGQAASAASAAILADLPVNTIPPTLTPGIAQDGQPLGSDDGAWIGSGAITYTYQWQLTTDGGITWTDVPGATGSTYTPPLGSAGKQTRVVVTATNPDGSSQATSPASAVILPNPPLDTATPTLTGTAQDGHPLGLTAGAWSGPGPIAYSYQWQISSDGGATWTDIAGATATTFTPSSGAAGKRARVVETATNADGSGQAASAASAVILAEPPAPPTGSAAPAAPAPTPSAPSSPATEQSTSKPLDAEPTTRKQPKPKPKKPKKSKLTHPKKKPAKAKAKHPRAAPQWHVVPR